MPDSHSIYRRALTLALLALLIACLWVLTAAARPDDSARVTVPRVSRPPRLEEFADMDSQSAASELQLITGFIQERPSDGAPATERTEVYLGRDDRNLYVVWSCFDKSPGRIRAHMTRRESFDQDDYVEITLDALHDRRHGLVFAANPLGVQLDALWTDAGATRDTSWDTVWRSEGKLTPHGYVVLMAIPFRGLRFRPGDEAGWGVTLLRFNARESERDYWPRVSSRISGLLNQAATLKGFDEAASQRNMEFKPYITGRAFRSLDQRDPAQPQFQTRTLDVRAGLDSKFVFHNSLVLDVTVNPDFAQVESDEPQNTVNQRFEVFFPEKRPFFLENSSIFDFQPSPAPLSQLVFTRRIADPEFGARLTGKIGPWNLGLLAVDDRAPGEAVPLTSPVSRKRAYFALARITRDIGEQSSIGAIYTDREFAGEFNRAGGLDATVKLDRNWTAFLRGVVSSTQSDAAGYLYGSNFEVSLDGKGRRFQSAMQYQDISSGFRTDAGFVSRTDIRRLFEYFHFYFRPEGKYLVNWGPESNLERVWDHSGLGVRYNLNASLLFGFRRNTSIFFPILSSASDTFRPQDFAGLPGNRKFTQNSLGIDFRTAPVRTLSFNILAFRQGAVNIVVPADRLPQLADEATINATLSLRPAGRLQIDNTYVLDQLRYIQRGQSIFNNHIIRSKWNYQLNRRLSFRFIGQYNGLLANPINTSLQTTRNLNFDFLITYLVHPGTAAYIGYNSNLQKLDPSLCRRSQNSEFCAPPIGGLVRTQNGFINDARQFFVKVSYLIRP